MYFLLTKKDLPELPVCSHENISYVDNLTQTVGSKNKTDLQIYIQTLYELTVGYFNSNLLAINSTKTEILNVTYGDEEEQDLYIMTEEGEIMVYLNKRRLFKTH